MGEANQHQLSGKTVVLVSLAGLAIGGPLLALMGFCFLATGALFLVTSPLLLIFSPLLLGAGFVFVTALAGFGVATVIAIAALSSFGWVFQSYRGGPRLVHGLDTAGGMIKEDVDEVKESGKEWAGYLQQNAHENMPNRR